MLPGAYAPVSEPPLPGPVSIEVKQGSSRYWLATAARVTCPVGPVQLLNGPGARLSQVRHT